MEIKKLNDKIINKLHSEQIIYSIFNVIKELIDNSIDSNADEIFIEITNFGIQNISIIDNGIGFKKEDLEKIGKRGVTSKLKNSIKDELDIKQLGFKGEALFGLIQQSRVIIRTKNKEDDSYECLFNTNIKQIKVINKLKIGTEIFVSDLFKNNSLRREIIENEKMKDFKNLINLIKEYSISYYNIHFKFIHNNKNNKSLIFDNKKKQSLKINIQKIFQINNIVNKDIANNDFKINIFTNLGIKEYENYNFKNKKLEKTFIFYLNNRPINPIKNLLNIFKKSLNTINSKMNNIILITFIEINNKFIDINLSKDKRKVIFSNIDCITEKFKILIKEIINNNINKIDKVINLNNFIKNNSVVEIKENKDFIPIISEKESSLNSKNLNKKIPKKVNEPVEYLKSLEKKIDLVKIYNKNEFIKEEDDDDYINDIEENINFKNNDFLNLKIIGQFNKGFIICHLNNLYYMIDQHAADEKYNYEKSLNNIKLESFNIKESIKINLEIEDKLIFSKYYDLLVKQGYKFNFEENSNIIEIISIPCYKKYFYTINDFFTIINELNDNNCLIINNIIIFKKIKRILASNACRYSIMIGKILNNKEMNRIIFNLSELETPFHCPHGRPTIIKINNK